jgi:hypothetical protein
LSYSIISRDEGRAAASLGFRFWFGDQLKNLPTLFFGNQLEKLGPHRFVWSFRKEITIPSKIFAPYERLHGRLPVRTERRAAAQEPSNQNSDNGTTGVRQFYGCRRT